MNEKEKKKRIFFCSGEIAFYVENSSAVIITVAFALCLMDFSFNTHVRTHMHFFSSISTPLSKLLLFIPCHLFLNLPNILPKKKKKVLFLPDGHVQMPLRSF